MPGPLRTYRIGKNRLERALTDGWRLEGGVLKADETKARHTLFLGRLDSSQADYAWGRLRFDCEIHFEAALRVYALATNDSGLALDGEVVAINDFLLSGGYPLQRKERFFEMAGAAVVTGADDVLLSGQKGRYLHIFIDLIGMGAASLGNIRVYAPNDNFFMSLPEIYRENGEFLSRYLSIFYSLYSDLQTTIDHIDRYIDAAQADKQALQIFAGWLGLTLDGDFLDELHLRRLIQGGFDLIKRKGTREAIEGIVALFVDEPFFVVERHCVGKYLMPGGAMTSDRLYGTNPYGFTILIYREADEGLHLRLKYLINQFKPARSVATIVFLGDNGYLDGHCYLDVNARILKTDTGIADAKASLNGMTVMA